MTENKKLWGGRFTNEADPSFAAFNKSFSFDRRLFQVDLRASVAHCNGLAAAGVLSQEEAEAIKNGLNTLLAQAESSDNYFDDSDAEDI
ncbi:MAG TPA: lyase family protein, partial [Pyrinomonadaceae bacterium]|nr:lyase family protein [Pyrinomonadaceae bacterium]